MSAYTYEEITSHGYKRGACAVCGKTAERSKAFTNTLNPWNRNVDGTVRTRVEIWAMVDAERRDWESAPVVHARCEDQFSADLGGKPT